MRKATVRVLSAPEFDSEVVQEFFESKSKKRGLFKREPLEETTHFPLIWRAFRFVHWLDDEGERLGASLIDEELASTVSLNEDEQILLWRPRYADLETLECKECKPFVFGAADDDSIQKVVNAIIKRRKKAQDALEELAPEGLEDGQQTALTIGISRTQDRQRERQKVADARIRYHYGILVGTSLVLDVAQDTKVQSGEIRDRVYVGTYLAEFRNHKSGDIRIGVMETPGVSSLKAAWSLGRALTKLCELSDASRKQIEKSIS